MIYGYVRVSTKGQARDGNGLEAQEEQLKNAGATRIYADAFTGTKANRPQLDTIMGVLVSGDTIVVTKLDRIARSASQGMVLIQSLLDKGINVHVLNMGMMDNTPTGRLIRNVLLAFAEFERDMIVERTSEGKEIAKQNSDFREGRPRKFSSTQVNHALSLLGEYSYKQVEQMIGLSKSTLIRYRRKT